MRRDTFTPLLAFLVAFALLVIGCGSGGGSTDSSGDPALRIFVTDAPFPLENVESAVVKVERVDIREAGGKFEELVSFNDRTLDLVQLQNGITELLYQGDPAVGDYDALRIIVHPVEIVIRDGQESRTYTEFKVPSGPQTGVKVFVDPVISVQTSLTMDLMLDFDLSRSFVVQGNPTTPAGIKGFHFKPVIRATNVSVAGTLTFRVMSDNGTPGDTADDFYLNGAEYSVIDTGVNPEVVVGSGASGTDPMGSPNNPDDQGFVFHPAILAGTYQLLITREGYEEYEQDGVAIVAANLTNLGTITLTATGGAIEGKVTTEITPPGLATMSFPLADVRVAATPSGETVEAASAMTDETGAYVLDFMAPLEGPYDLIAEKEGYESDTATSDPAVAGADPSVVDFVLHPLMDDLTVTVQDETDAPLEGLTVDVFLSDGTIPMGTGTTGIDGAHTFLGLPTASYIIKVLDSDVEVASTAYDLVGGTGAKAITIVVSTP
jgi:hypothetical protein